MTGIRIPPFPCVTPEVQSWLNLLFSDYLLTATHVTRLSIWSYSPSTSKCIEEILSNKKTAFGLKRIVHVELVTGFHRLSKGADMTDVVILKPLYFAISFFPNLSSLAFLNLHQDDGSLYGGVLQDFSLLLLWPKLQTLEMVSINPLSKSSLDSFFDVVTQHKSITKVVVSNALMSYSPTDSKTPSDNDTMPLFCSMLRSKTTLESLHFKLDPLAQTSFTPATYLKDWDVQRFRHPPEVKESRDYGFKLTSLTTLAYEISLHKSLQSVILPGFAPMWTRNDQLLDFFRLTPKLESLGFADARPMRQLSSSSSSSSSASNKTPLQKEIELVIKYFSELETDRRRRWGFSQFLLNKQK